MLYQKFSYLCTTKANKMKKITLKNGSVVLAKEDALMGLVPQTYVNYNQAEKRRQELMDKGNACMVYKSELSPLFMIRIFN